MRSPISLLGIAIVLAACAGGRTSEPYGNFIHAPTKLGEKAMANDVAGKIAMLYPPARTSIKMRQATPDAFGATLTTALRGKGYALAEFVPGQRTTDPTSKAAATPAKTSDLAVAYLVDQPMETGVYRVTVLLNDESLSRVYQAKDGNLVPAGYWVRKE